MFRLKYKLIYFLPRQLSDHLVSVLQGRAPDPMHFERTCSLFRHLTKNIIKDFQML